MSSQPWKYASNQFLVATEHNLSLVDEINDDHLPKLQAANAPGHAFEEALTATTTIIAGWDAARQTLTNAEANLTGAQTAFTHALDQLTPRPNPETHSTLEAWMHILEGQAPFGSALYRTLLPRGRETLTTGTQDEQVDAVLAFQVRLTQQPGKPILTALATTVANWINPVDALRTDRNNADSAVTQADTALKAMRPEWAAQMISNVGDALKVFKDDVSQVETLWDASLLQDPPQDVPSAPAAAPVWDPVARTLTATELPAAATRLVGYRLAPGGAPEQLVTGAKDALSVVIPAIFTFTPGVQYQLWVTGKNGRGQSDPSPSVMWTAPETGN